MVLKILDHFYHRSGSVHSLTLNGCHVKRSRIGCYVSGTLDILGRLLIEIGCLPRKQQIKGGLFEKLQQKNSQARPLLSRSDAPNPRKGPRNRGEPRSSCGGSISRGQLDPSQRIFVLASIPPVDVLRFHFYGFVGSPLPFPRRK